MAAATPVLNGNVRRALARSAGALSTLCARGVRRIPSSASPRHSPGNARTDVACRLTLSWRYWPSFCIAPFGKKLNKSKLDLSATAALVAPETVRVVDIDL